MYDGMLSDNTKAYLKRYQAILCEMIQAMESGFVQASQYKSISAYVVDTLVPQCQCAVNICEEVLKYTTNIPVQKMAKNIMKFEKQCVHDLQMMRGECLACTNNDEEIKMYLACYCEIIKVMYGRMQCAPTHNNINFDFICEIIPQHEGGIQMCRNALNFRLSCQLACLLDTIVQTECAGIQELLELQRINLC